MRDAEKTVGGMMDKLKTAFIGSVDAEGLISRLCCNPGRGKG